MVTVTRRQIKHGADWIKIHATGSIPNHDGELQVWTLDEMKAVCDTAHDLGVPVVAHCRSSTSTTGRGTRRRRPHPPCVLRRRRGPRGGRRRPGAAICPTFTFLANLADYGHQVGAGTGMREIFVGEIKATAGFMRNAYDAGVRLLCGSESGFALTPYGHWHARELEVFVDELGLSGLEAITCATRNNALAMRMEGELGVVRRATGPTCSSSTATRLPTCGSSRTAAACAPVVSRGEPVDLDQPWPQRRPIAGERCAAPPLGGRGA